MIKLANEVEIECLTSIGEEQCIELSNLLIRVVEEGASVGYLPPLQLSKAKDYWVNVLNPDVLLFVAKINEDIVGSIQLHLCNKQNGGHRAEIAKLMTHPDYRRKGIGLSLMNKAEERAKKENRSLLVLDTREGDPSNQLYKMLNYSVAGHIPRYAISSDGHYHTTVFYYKVFG